MSKWHVDAGTGVITIGMVTELITVASIDSQADQCASHGGDLPLLTGNRECAHTGNAYLSG